MEISQRTEPNSKGQQRFSGACSRWESHLRPQMGPAQIPLLVLQTTPTTTNANIQNCTIPTCQTPVCSSTGPASMSGSCPGTRTSLRTFSAFSMATTPPQMCPTSRQNMWTFSLSASSSTRRTLSHTASSLLPSVPASMGIQYGLGPDQTPEHLLALNPAS